VRILALVTLTTIVAGLFGGELLDPIGLPGIWFPFGIGVSRTQYVHAILLPLLGFLIVRSSCGHGQATRRPSEDRNLCTSDPPSGVCVLLSNAPGSRQAQSGSFSGLQGAGEGDVSGFRAQAVFASGSTLRSR
jgi:hypothetical protein